MFVTMYTCIFVIGSINPFINLCYFKLFILINEIEENMKKFYAIHRTHHSQTPNGSNISYEASINNERSASVYKGIKYKQRVTGNSHECDAVRREMGKISNSNEAFDPVLCIMNRWTLSHRNYSNICSLLLSSFARGLINTIREYIILIACKTAVYLKGFVSAYYSTWN